MSAIILAACIPVALVAGLLWGAALALFRQDRRRRTNRDVSPRVAPDVSRR